MKYPLNVSTPNAGEHFNWMQIEGNTGVPDLAIWLGEELARELTALGRSLPDYQGNAAWMLPIPATFVVGRDGLVKARFVDPDFRRRMAVEELIAALQAAR